MSGSQICGNKGPAAYAAAQLADTEGFILKLSDVSCADRLLVGTKAANLGELARIGFPVPEGFILTTSAFRYFLATNSLGPDSPVKAVAVAPLPRQLADVLTAALIAFSDTPLAVRSSAVGEDLANASFAGLYETVLGVKSVDAVADAVRRCFTSAFSERVATYREIRGLKGTPNMAVLIQSLIPADTAGVAFTANPVTGDPSETLVSAVRGLGNRLVSGQTTPDEWRVKGNSIICDQAPEGAVDSTQVMAIADLARRVEWCSGCPQDVEWALCDGHLFLLQARPITALPQRPATSSAP